jgi:hypothetical protein
VVLIRTLSYDLALGRREGPLRIGVVAPPGDPVAAEVLRVVGGLVGVTVGGRVVAEPVSLPTGGATPWLVLVQHQDVLVLCPEIDAALPAVVDAARELDVATLALDGTFVGKGAAVGVRPAGDRLEIVVDLAAAEAEGARLSGELLEIAHRVRR